MTPDPGTPLTTEIPPPTVSQLAAEEGRQCESAPPPSDEAPKYDVEELLAEGAEGRVYLVRDNDLQRHVAMKVMHPDTARHPRHVQRFLAEARRTASLEHAGIPAVHDLGYSATGELYFTMRFVEGRTLRDVITARAAGDPDTVREWTLIRLVQALQRVAAAIDFAHSRGLLHRDLKPENIALGDFSEVLVLDWGLSKRLGRDEHAQSRPGSATGIYATQVGAVKGTPMYMAPEQARGAVNDLDARCDVFSLGAMLYEILCGEGPYAGRTAEEVLDHARRGEVVAIEDRPAARDAPRTLVETAMRALSAERDDRHASARAFSDDLQEFLEGTREKTLRAAEAHQLLLSAQRLEKRRKDLLTEGERLDRMAGDLRRGLRPWSPLDEKRRLWQLEDAAVRNRVDAADAHARAMDQLARALALDESNETARRTLALLCVERFLEAERRGAHEDAAWLRRMVERYAQGSLDVLLRDTGCLLVASEPDGARVTLRRVEERDRRFSAVTTQELGRAPVAAESLASGHYELSVEHAGYEKARIPVRMRRGEQRTVSVRLLPQGAVPPGWIWIPGGSFPAGDEGTETEVPDFLVMELPVLLRDYAKFLDEFAERDLSASAEHVPWVDTHGALLRLDAKGRHVFCAASPLSRRPIPEHADLPVVGITRRSAEAYAAWLTETTGRVHRLPTEIEWEKAARGTDGRLYPWGNVFDATFCSMVESTPDEPTLRPVGQFPGDLSPYGVRDLAGGVREWCADDIDAGRRQAVCRGGAWYLRARECTVTSRWLVDADTRNPGIGFRLCLEIPPA